MAGKWSERQGKRQASSEHGRQGEQTTGNVAGKGRERHGNRQAEGEWQAQGVGVVPAWAVHVSHIYFLGGRHGGGGGGDSYVRTQNQP